MNKFVKKHLIHKNLSVREVLSRLDNLAADAVLFLVDNNQRLLGSLTDGDMRRGLINGLRLEDEISKFIIPNPKFLKKCQYNLSLIKEWREKNYKIIPVVNSKHEVIDIINFRLQKSYLPIDAILMAGGKGTRLHPLTLKTPKPLLKVGNKPIIEYNIDQLITYGVKHITLSINYLGEQLVNYFRNGEEKNINIKYVEESSPLGTIGSVSLMTKFHNEYILVMNSDLLTNINYEEIFNSLLELDADMVVATTCLTLSRDSCISFWRARMPFLVSMHF